MIPKPTGDPRITQLERMLANPLFVSSGRQGRFLRYVTEETIAGRGDLIKEYTIGLEVYDKPTEYDPRVDSTVRVEAGKLRARLEKYYSGDGENDPVRILIPKGAYVPVFEARKVVEMPAPPVPIVPAEERLHLVPNPSRRHISPAMLGIAAVVAILTTVAGVFLWRKGGPPPDTPAAASRPLTTDLGVARDPALSSEGRLLVYASDRGGRGDLDLYLQPVGGGEPLRLTNDAANDHNPAFSPDGTQIAFRSERKPPGIYVVPALGGESRLLVPEGHGAKYSPDGKWIAYYTGDPRSIAGSKPSGAIWVIPSSGGEPRRLRADFTVATRPIWTPDGNHILFHGHTAQYFSMASADWWVTAADGSGPAIETGVREALVRQKMCGIWAGWPAATFFQGDVLFAAHCRSQSDLWRVHLSSNWKMEGAARRVTLASGGADSPAASGGTVVFAAESFNSEIWYQPLSQSGEPSGEPVRVTEQTSADFLPSVSADGSRIVYTSDRSGRLAIWMRDVASGKDRLLVSSDLITNYSSFDSDGVVYHEIHPDPKVGLNHIAWRVGLDGHARTKLCEECAFGGPGPGGKGYLDIDGTPIHIRVREGTSAQIYLSHPRHDLFLPTPSPDRRWLAYVVSDDSKGEQMFVVPFTPGAKPENEWRFVTDGTMPTWSLDGKRIYYVRRHGDDYCLAMVAMDSDAGKPAGEPSDVLHFHHARRRLNVAQVVFRVLSVARDKVVFAVDERSSQIHQLQTGR